MSILADCVFEMDDLVLLLLSLYEDGLDLTSFCPFSYESDDPRYDVDLGMDKGCDNDVEYPTMLALSPRSRPRVDLETDIVNGFEELWSRASMQPTSSDERLASISLSQMPKSEWLFSTIGSIRGEHERRGP